MAPFDRSHRTSNQSAIVSIALSCTIFEIFDVEYSDLEIYVRVALRTYARSVRRRNLQTRLFLPMIVWIYLHLLHTQRTPEKQL